MRIYRIASTQSEFCKLSQTFVDQQKLERLNEILSNMKVPFARKNDPRWLMRNLGIYNGDHPDFQEAISILKELSSLLANPMSQENADNWNKKWSQK